MQVHCEYTELVDIEKLIPNPDNPNEHSREQIDWLARVIKARGWRSPIVVSKRSGFITKGHGRLESAKLNGYEQVPVDFQYYNNEAEEYADMVSDNELARLSRTNMSKINADLPKFGPELDIDLLGIPDFKIDPSELPELEDLPKEVKIKDVFKIEIDCKDEWDCTTLYEELKNNGHKVKIISL